MKNQQLTEALRNAGARLDYDLTIEFLKSSMEVHQAHFDLIGHTLAPNDQIRRQRVLNQGAFLLAIVIEGFERRAEL